MAKITDRAPIAISAPALKLAVIRHLFPGPYVSKYILNLPFFWRICIYQRGPLLRWGNSLECVMPCFERLMTVRRRDIDAMEAAVVKVTEKLNATTSDQHQIIEQSVLKVATSGQAVVDGELDTDALAAGAFGSIAAHGVGLFKH